MAIFNHKHADRVAHYMKQYVLPELSQSNSAEEIMSAAVMEICLHCRRSGMRAIEIFDVLNLIRKTIEEKEAQLRADK